MSPRSTFALAALVLLTSGVTPAPPTAEGECFIRTVAQEADFKPGTMAAVGYSNDPEEVQRLYVPVTLDAGRYAVTVTRRGSDVYSLDGIGAVAKTMGCFEFVYSASAVLVVRTASGRSVGTLYF